MNVSQRGSSGLGKDREDRNAIGKPLTVESTAASLADLMGPVPQHPSRRERVRPRQAIDHCARILGRPDGAGEICFSSRSWRFCQRLVASVAMVALLPVYVLVGATIRATSRGPTLFSQVRRGFMGKPFVIRKFRTMTEGKASESELVVQMSDPKVTRVGRVLRFLKLDELPQMWNVARGDMEIVGPRPIPGNLEHELIGNIKGFRARYTVKPGLTNMSQIAIDDNAIGFEGMLYDWDARFAGELIYLREKSFRCDCIIIFRTSVFLVKRFVLAVVAKIPRQTVVRKDPDAKQAYDHGELEQVLDATAHWDETTLSQIEDEQGVG